MKINKFKKIGSNKYKIYFDNESLIVYEDVILKYNLLYKKESPFMRDFINDNSYLLMVVISKLDFPPILL